MNAYEIVMICADCIKYVHDSIRVGKIVYVILMSYL